MILSTGSELREPGSDLGHDSIYDGNSYLLAASARRAGAIAYRVGILPDEPRAFMDALSDQLVRADLVVTSGGVSMGDFDVVKEALRAAGTVWFGGVGMRPGQAAGFGVVGEDETPIFTSRATRCRRTSPSRPSSCPPSAQADGRAPHSRPTSRALLTHGISSPQGRRQFRAGEYAVDRGGPTVAPVGGRLAPDRRPRVVERADRGARGRDLAVGR